MKWRVWKQFGRWWAFSDDNAGVFDTWREAFRYAEWHATGRMEPTS